MNQKDIKEFSRILLHWYDHNGRNLPWRTDPTPYRVWISEIMLQQTRVDTVIPYFERFMEEAPTLEDLVKLPEERILKLWEGLGYYSRARNIKKAAHIIQDSFCGEVPSDFNDLLSLPGIGPYTAGAIASMAFQVKVPAVDGNVLRILARITANHGDIKSTKVIREIEALVKDLLPEDRPGHFNQALMDLGATICLPNGAPKCIECPMQYICKAYAKGLATHLPVKAKKKPRKIEKKTVLLIQYRDQVALWQRPSKGLLSNLWEYPNVEGHLSLEELNKSLEEWGITPKEIQPLADSKHIFSHLEWHMIAYHVTVREVPGDFHPTWASKEELIEQYSIPAAYKAYTDTIV